MFQPRLPRLAEPLALQPHLAMPPRIDATERFSPATVPAALD